MSLEEVVLVEFLEDAAFQFDELKTGKSFFFCLFETVCPAVIKLFTAVIH